MKIPTVVVLFAAGGVGVVSLFVLVVCYLSLLLLLLVVVVAVVAPGVVAVVVAVVVVVVCHYLYFYVLLVFSLSPLSLYPPVVVLPIFLWVLLVYCSSLTSQPTRTIVKHQPSSRPTSQAAKFD